MADIINTEHLDPAHTGGDRGHYIYNGLDCCLTHEIFQEIEPLLDEHTSLTYAYERTLQAPAMEMMLHGILIDQETKIKMLQILHKQASRLKSILDRYAYTVWGKELNPASPKQLQDFFYGVMGIPEIYSSKKGVSKVSTDREALEQMQAYYHAQPIIRAILALRDANKKISVLKTGIDEDDRIRCSYGVAGTTTGRFSSSSNAFGSGSNLQNINELLRAMFVADKGYKLAYIDLEQAESRAVGLLAWMATGQDNYLRACDAGDLHTTVTKMVWKDLAWTGELSEDKSVAEQKYYRDFSYRDLAKRAGHGCLTAEHEVLTSNRGWVYISEVQDGEGILAWDFEKAKLSWEIPTAWVRKRWFGKMYSIEGKEYSMRVTSDHRMPLCQGELVEAPAESLYGRSGWVLPGVGSIKSAPLSFWLGAIAEQTAVVHRAGDLRVEEYDGGGCMVYCPTVASGGFLVRRGKHEALSLNSNYYAQPPTISRNLKIPLDIAKGFQHGYFKGFPEINLWHQDVAKRLRTEGCLITPLSRKRYFFDRVWEDATLRAAIAYVPQSMIADMLNYGMYLIWKNMYGRALLLAQIHDAVIIMYREEEEDSIIPEALSYIQTEFFLGRPFTIPAEAQVGWNWGKQVTEEKLTKKYGTLKEAAMRGYLPNPDGLVKWKPGNPDTRARQHYPKKLTPLELLQQTTF